MADCYYHGYSGGPGPCTQCERERFEHLDQGTLGASAPDLTQDDFFDTADFQKAKPKKKKRRRHLFRL